MEYLGKFIEPEVLMRQKEPFSLRFITLDGINMGLSYIPHINNSLAYVRASAWHVVIHKLADDISRRESAWDEGRSHDQARVNHC